MANKVAELVFRDNSGSIAGRNYFRMKSLEEITMKDLEEAQARIGYHPDGYGLMGPAFSREDGFYVAHWSCAESCD